MKKFDGDFTVFQIFASEPFLEKLARLSKEQQRRIEKIKQQLQENPFIGKPLGYKWFREKKIDGFRPYYLIYEEMVCVLMVDFSDKKNQQATINAIKNLFEYYKDGVQKKRIIPSV